jgi:hypothetical protein
LISVSIKYHKYLLCFFLRASDFVVFKGFFEFLEVKGPAFIGVHDLELALEPDEATYSTLEELFLETVQDDLILLLLGHCAKWFGMFLLLLSASDMFVILTSDGAHEWVLLAFLTCDLVVNTGWVRLVLEVT